MRRIQLFPIRALAIVSTFTAMLALVLTLLGIYGVLSYSVTQRTKEIGLRIALGASRKNIVQLVVRQGLIFAIVGALAGVMTALLATRLLSSILFRVSPTDPMIFLAVIAILLLIALMACWIPARRAMKIEPLTAEIRVIRGFHAAPFFCKRLSTELY